MRIVESLPATDYRRPDDASMTALLAIVKANPFGLDLRGVDEGPFRRAMFAIGHQFRLAEPSTKIYYVTHCDRVNDFLTRFDMAEVDGSAIMAAIVCQSDISYRLNDPAQGQVIEIALDPYSGAKCSNAWAALLQGAPLRAPLPARAAPKISAQPIPRPRIYQESADGRMVEIAENEPVRWSR